jgi:hypothetical protein
MSWELTLLVCVLGWPVLGLVSLVLELLIFGDLGD